MRDYSKSLKAVYGIRNCFTYFEAAEIIEPILGATNFMEFIEKSGYTDSGVPNKDCVKKGVFLIVQSGDEDPEYMSHDLLIFITKSGMVSIFQRALQDYLKAQSLASKSFIG